MASDRIPRMTEDDAEELRSFIRDYVASSGCKGVVIGLSGGIDSAVVAKLAADALGPEKVHTVFMPSAVTSESDYECTRRMAEMWGIGYEVVRIQKVVDELASAVGGDITMLERGNLSARCRMIILYNRAKSMDCIVLGTSNQSELMMGYFTKHGDGASDAVPLINLYKTSVRQLARIIGVPQDIIDKPPSAGLWEGQTDEDEMGISYVDLDQVLFGMEHGLTDSEISDQIGLDLDKVSAIRKRVSSMTHKRVPAARPGKSI